MLLNKPNNINPAVNVHISGYKIAKLMEDLLDLDDFKLVEKNIRIIENAETSEQVALVQDQEVNRDVNALENVDVERELEEELLNEQRTQEGFTSDEEELI